MKRAKEITIRITLGFLGIISIFIGLIGIVLPILPGWPFIFIGLILISLESPALDNYINKLASKNKYFEKYYLKIRLYMRNYLGYEI